ncbi:MAG: hypothetical protein ABSH20_21740, partial [Tepidisphaeraceae bacterium]
GNSHYVNSTGNVGISATETPTGAATSTGVSGGGLNVAGTATSLTLNPTAIAYVGANTTVIASGNIGVGATLVKTGSSASSTGSGGALIGVQLNSSTTSSTLTADAHSGAQSVLQAGGNVSITTNSAGGTSANSANGSGGLVAVGDSTATSTMYNANSAYVDSGSTVRAGGNVTISANSDNDLGTVNAVSVAGGAVASVSAGTVADIDYNTTATVGQGALVVAGATLSVLSNTTSEGYSLSHADGSGLGGNGSANDDNNSQGARIGQNQGANNTTTIGSGATLTAANLSLGATVSSVALHSRSESYAAGAVGVSTSVARIQIDATNSVLINSGASITGTSGIDMRARFDNVNTGIASPADAYAKVLGATGTVNPTADNSTNLTTLIQTAPTASVAAGPRSNASTPLQSVPTYNQLALVVDSSDGAVNGNKTGTVDREAAAFGTDHENGSVNQNNSVNWNGNAAILPGVNPQLTIDSSGHVSIASNASASITGNTITIADINHPQPSQAYVNSGSIGGSGGTWQFPYNYDHVSITNNSNLDLQVGNIEAIDRNLLDQPRVSLNAPSITLTFAIRHTVGSTLVNIQNTGSGNIILTGTIDNPVGETRIVDAGGSILSTGAATVVTNRLGDRTDFLPAGATLQGISATNGSIGTAANPIDIQFVASLLDPTQAYIAAGQDVYLDLTGRLRDATQTAMTVNVDSITAGGSVMLTLEGGISDPAAGTAGTVDITTPAGNGFYTNFFRPDAGAAAALNPGVFVNLGASVPVASTYDFRAVDAGGNRTQTGLTAGNALSVTGAHLLPTDTPVNVTGIMARKGSGNIDVHVTGNINLTESAGDFALDSIDSTAGNVSLTAAAQGASIYYSGGSTSSTARVIGNSITLNAPTGGIGSANNILTIQSSAQAFGTLTVLAQNTIYVEQTTGSLYLASVVSTTADVVLEALLGSILDGNGVASLLADIEARSVDLIVTGGGLGSTADDLKIDGAGTGQALVVLPNPSFVPAPGQLYATASQGIYIQEVTGELDLSKVVSTSGAVRLTVFPNTILNGNLTLLGNGTSVLGVSVPHGLISGPSGMTLVVPDDISLPAGTLVSSSTSVTVNDDAVAGRHSSAGSTVNVAGDIQAPSVVINAGGTNNLDFVEITSPSGINAAGATTLNGLGSNDRFFIDATAANMTINGGAGVDRFYISSNANKNLYVTNGVYNDEATAADPGYNPLTQLTGTMNGIVGNLTINTAAGQSIPGGGVQPNLIFVSAQGSTATLSGTITTATIAGLGMTGVINYSTTGAVNLYAQMGAGADTLRVKGLGAGVGAYAYAGAGNSTLNVGNDSNRLSDFAGVLAFFGGTGTNTLNVYDSGDTAATTHGQLSAIGVTSLGGMGTNSQINAAQAFGAYLAPGQTTVPAAIYYAQRVARLNGAPDSFVTSVQNVNVYLGSGNNVFNVDSSAPGVNAAVIGGNGNDTLVAGSTPQGLYPNSLKRLAYMAGPVTLNGGSGVNTVTLDDSGDLPTATSTTTVGQLQGSTVTLDSMPATGSVSYASASNININLSPRNNTLYVASTTAGLTANINVGSGQNTVYVGQGINQTPTQSSLDGVQGPVNLYGGNIANETLYVEDASNTNAHTFTVSNAITGSRQLTNGTAWPVDTTTIARDGIASINYQ